MLRTPLAADFALVAEQQPVGSVWLTVMSFEALLFTDLRSPSSCWRWRKERTELRHRTAAMVRSAHRHRQPRAFLQDAADSGQGSQRQSPAYRVC